MMAKAAKKPTINDVAHRAGFSKATVSAVLNNKSIVADATRRKVLQAIKELNYRPSTAARQQFQPVTRRTLGFIIKEADNPYYAEVLKGLEYVAREQGYQVYTSSSGGEIKAERRIVEQCCDMGIAGLVMAPILHDAADLSHIYELKRSNIPYVLLEKVPGLPSNLVDVDNELASYEAVKHLIELGHARIIHLAGPPYSKHSEERVAGVRRAFSESHLKFDDRYILSAGDALADGYRVAKQYFTSPDIIRPTGITCYNDLVALGVLKALHELGVNVPQEVSVVGFDNLNLLDYLSLPLTSVNVPRYEMGTRAAEILIRQIESPSSTVEKVNLEATLVDRQSTAPPRAEQGTPDAKVVARLGGAERPAAQ